MKIPKILILEKFKNGINLLIILFIGFTLYQRAPQFWQNFQQQGSRGGRLVLSSINGESSLIPPEDAKPAVLIFWATWCGPCEFELSRYKEAILNGEIPSDRVFAISMGEDMATVAKAANERGYPFQVFLDPQWNLAKRYNVSLTPTVVHVLGDGTVDWIGTGLSPTAMVRAKSLFSETK